MVLPLITACCLLPAVQGSLDYGIITYIMKPNCTSKNTVSNNVVVYKNSAYTPAVSMLATYYYSSMVEVATASRG